MTKVKICGIQTVGDALLAAQHGADFIGMVFVPNRRRLVPVSRAQEIVKSVRARLENPPQMVGLFADASIETVNHIVTTCDLNLVQLCGQESLQYCRQTNVPALKVIHVSEKPQSTESVIALSRRIRDYSEHGHMITLDRMIGGLQGGTGLAFDWGTATQLSGWGLNFLLAGGLTPDNVTEAIKIVNPWGVDVSSGVETDNVKDPAKIKHFIANVRDPRLN